MNTQDEISCANSTVARLPIKDIKFGMIDAHHEMLELGEDFYLSSFLQYDKYKISSFLNGENYFICGNKGMGKTALLKYLECKFSEDPRNLVLPIRFKSQFDDEDKKQIRNSGNNLREAVLDSDDVEEGISYVQTWQVFIIHHILTNESRGEYSIFEDSPQLRELRAILDLIYGDLRDKVAPKISRGRVTVKAALPIGVEASLQAEVEFNQERSVFNYRKAVKAVLSRFARLTADRTNVVVLIDELEPSVRTSKEFKRDVELVRDLILGIDRMNDLSKQKGYGIKIIASIRSEVINHVNVNGFEINKCIEDFGVNVTWFQKGGDRADSPLIKLIENKIHASEKKEGLSESEDVWKAYFTPMVNDMEVRQYILSYSWQRPRDVIRMMRLVQNECTGEDIISQVMFDRAMQRYSELSWNEIAEELVLSYPQKGDLRVIKQFFTRIEVPFTFQYLRHRAEAMSKIDDDVDAFFKRYKLRDFLKKMFEWGIIGNSGERMAFEFLGDRELSLVDDMILHRPLRNFFAVRSRKHD